MLSFHIPTKGFYATSARPLCSKNPHQRERKTQKLSAFSPLSISRTRPLSAIQPPGQHGSKLKVKGLTLGTAVRSTEQHTAHLWPCIIQRPTVAHFLTLLLPSLLSASFCLSAPSECSTNTSFYHFLSRYMLPFRVVGYLKLGLKRNRIQVSKKCI